MFSWPLYRFPFLYLWHSFSSFLHVGFYLSSSYFNSLNSPHSWSIISCCGGSRLLMSSCDISMLLQVTAMFFSWCFIKVHITAVYVMADSMTALNIFLFKCVCIFLSFNYFRFYQISASLLLSNNSELSFDVLKMLTRNKIAEQCKMRTTMGNSLFGAMRC